MSFASLLDHKVFTRTFVDSGAEDDHGQPIVTPHDGSLFAAAIQPKSAREMLLVSQDGQALNDFTIYALPQSGLLPGMALIHDPALCGKAVDLPAGRFDLNGIRSETGRGHHLAFDARLIGPATAQTAEGS
jgi:hypothetical protein